MPEDSRKGHSPAPHVNRIRHLWPTLSVQAARLLAAAGAAWSALFAASHFYWAAGGRTGVTDTAGVIANRPLFLAYDVAAGVVFATAAAAGIILARVHDGRPQRHSWLMTVTAWGSLLSLLRGFGGLIQDLISFAVGNPLGAGVCYDMWFAIAGMLFLTAARGLRHTRA